MAGLKELLAQEGVDANEKDEEVRCAALCNAMARYAVHCCAVLRSCYLSALVSGLVLRTPILRASCAPLIARGLEESVKQRETWVPRCATPRPAMLQGRTALHFASGYNELECMKVGGRTHACMSTLHALRAVLLA